MGVNLNVALLLRQPWLILPEAIHAMADAISAERPGSVSESPSLLSVENGVGVIDIHGPIIRSPDRLSRLLFGATSHDDISAALQDAAGRNDVHAVFLDIDSPGGTVAGTPELAAQVASVGESKPVYAFSSGLMCSAAYWLASQAQAIYATPSARVGSIGVILPVVDSSEAFNRNGIKVEVFSVGKFKAMGTPGVSLTDEQRTLINGNLRDVAQDFHAAVLSRGRSIPASAMEGQDFSGKQAQRFNLAGLVPDRAEALRRLRVYHVAHTPHLARVDTEPTAMDSAIEDQLQSALAKAAKLETDLAASIALTDEEAKKVTGLTAQVESLTAELDSLRTVHTQADADLKTAKQTLESLSTRNAELEATDGDFRKQVAIEAARIAAECGTPVPAKVTPQGDKPAATPGASTQELIARFNELVAARKPQEAALFYQEHIAPLLLNR
jgi:signal peptide peptidase SppA